ncbi:hypothetical protein ASG89_07780 [Paenibacillus sp. Soil766]|uniref:sugar phosphate isomerase/epimerase family protein n=1 Tax=Paenibacillus sp. Soil766 TaxID=1736404 RepID=UPI0007100261|nr:TIM barrel protein [Paenibacillus sp. Soil766]KRE93381.1 hypothetical protein ASG89_07780 [Paenibacillus sp. Soil766]
MYTFGWCSGIQEAERLKQLGFDYIECALVTLNLEDEADFAAKQVNLPSIRVLADFYHMDEEQDPISTLIENKDWLRHIHLADTGRLSPGSGHYPYVQFAATLKASGYAGMISAECTVHDPEKEFAASLAFMREKFM